MNTKEMGKFKSHCDKYLQQNDCTVIHPTFNDAFHIDALLYSPNEKYPYWKLVTMGASDYKMPKTPNMLGDRNEYVMFIDPSENLRDQKIVSWYYSKLLEVATSPIADKYFLSYGHSVEWDEDENSNMSGAFVTLPQVIENVDFLRCKLGMFKETICLQIVLLTREEINQLMKIGPEQFDNYLYSEDGSSRHFICERCRSENF